MRLGICIGCLSKEGDPHGFGSAAEMKAAGYSYMELNITTFTKMTDEEFAAFEADVKASALPAEAGACLFPGDIDLYGDQTAAIEWAKKAVCRASRLGIKSLVFGSGGARKCPAGMDKEAAFEKLIELLKKMGPIAAEKDITFVIEPLNQSETDMINETGSGARLARAVDHPNVKLLVDYYHYGIENDVMDPANVPLIRHAHMAELTMRTCHTEMDAGLTAFFKVMKENGWDGRISFEGGAGTLPKEEFVANLKKLPVLLGL